MDLNKKCSKKKWWVFADEYEPSCFSSKKEAEKKIDKLIEDGKDPTCIDVFYGEKLNFRETGIKIDNPSSL